MLPGTHREFAEPLSVQQYSKEGVGGRSTVEWKPSNVELPAEVAIIQRSLKQSVRISGFQEVHTHFGLRTTLYSVMQYFEKQFGMDIVHQRHRCFPHGFLRVSKQETTPENRASWISRKRVWRCSFLTLMRCGLALSNHRVVCCFFAFNKWRLNTLGARANRQGNWRFRWAKATAEARNGIFGITFFGGQQR